MDVFVNQIGKLNSSYLRQLHFKFRRSEVWIVSQHRHCNIHLPNYPAISKLQHLERLSFSEILDDLCVDYSDIDIRRQPSTDMCILAFALQVMVSYFPKLSENVYLGPTFQVSLLSERLKSIYRTLTARVDPSVCRSRVDRATSRCN